MQFTEEKPIWRQIYELIAMRVLSGQWPEGERVASVREMAASVGVNPNTVMRSYERLTNDGIIYNRRGIGYFISPKARDIILENQRKEFLENELPAIKRKMQLLGIRLEDVL